MLAAPDQRGEREGEEREEIKRSALAASSAPIIEGRESEGEREEIE